jgi:hypothetical protein
MRAGVVPVCARNARLNWRRLMPAASRQMLECQGFCDVIAGKTKGGADAIVLRCQINGGCEL